MIKIVQFSNLQICNAYQHAYWSLSLFLVILSLRYSNIFLNLTVFTTSRLQHFAVEQKCYKRFIEAFTTVFRCAIFRVWAKIPTKGYFEAK